MAKMVNVTINGRIISVSDQSTIMEAADLLGIHIPRLCFLKGINEDASCRVCVVEIEGLRGLKNSCSVKVAEGMKIQTDTPRVRNTVKQTLQLLAGNHRFDCWKCPRERNCEFLNLLRRFAVDNVIPLQSEFHQKPTHVNDTSTAIVFDSTKCILCGRCIGACEKISGTNVLDFNERGFVTFVGSANGHPMSDSGCIYCGKCIQACPTGAIHEKDEVDTVEALLRSDNYVVAMVAPAVRVALGEEFGLPIGTNVEGKMYAALNELGFEDITDVNFAADLTIMEEGTEFIERLKKFKAGDKSVFPMFTSCSPGWIRYIERFHPEYLGNLSTAKSPQQMQGAIIKTYYAQKLGIDKEKIKTVSIMPCIAKKSEAARTEMKHDGIRDVDVVLTTRELARLIKHAAIDFVNLKDYAPTTPLATYTGAGVIFGATGGVMEAALRTAGEILDPAYQYVVDIPTLRGTEGIKEATFSIADVDVNVAVCHGTANLPELMRRIKSGDKQYHFIEVMACTGGCVNGGGQPVVPATVQEKIDVRSERAKALYSLDRHNELRKSHLNPVVKQLYQEFLGRPNSHIAHELLHTHYRVRPAYAKKK